jgi:anti-sigma B factor antagonist
MTFPSREADDAARLDLSPGGVGPSLRHSPLRDLAHRLRPERWVRARRRARPVEGPLRHPLEFSASDTLEAPTQRTDGRVDGDTRNHTGGTFDQGGAPPADSPATTPDVNLESPAPTQLEVVDVGRDGMRRLVLKGDLDTSSVPTLEDAISRCCSGETRAITLDLSRLTFIDSSGLWTITSARRWCERQGYGFSLIPGPEPVQQVFELTGLSDLLPFRSDDAKATGSSPGGAHTPR